MNEVAITATMCQILSNNWNTTICNESSLEKIPRESINCRLIGIFSVRHPSLDHEYSFYICVFFEHCMINIYKHKHIRV